MDKNCGMSNHLKAELQRMLHQKRLDGLSVESTRMDRKADRQHFMQRLHMEKIEEEMERNVFENIKTKKSSIDPSNERLLFEMMKLKSEDINCDKHRRQLWQNTQQLRDLKSKVRGAYVGRELQAQIAEKKGIKEKYKLYTKKYQQLVESNLTKLRQQQLQELQVSEANKLRYREELLNQIKLSSKEQVALKEYTRDNAMLDLALKLQQKEGLQEKEMSEKKLKQFQNDIEEAKKLQIEYKQNKLNQLREDEINVQKYLERQEKARKHSVERSIEIKKVKEQNTQKLLNTISSKFDKGPKEVEREKVLQFLAEERVREGELSRERKELRNTMKWREELQKSEQLQRQQKMERLSEENHIDSISKDRLEEEFKRYNNEIQSEWEEKHKRMRSYRRQLQEQIQDKHTRRVQHWQEERTIECQNTAKANKEMMKIEQESINMLKRHAPNLLGYFKPGLPVLT